MCVLVELACPLAMATATTPHERTTFMPPALAPSCPSAPTGSRTVILTAAFGSWSHFESGSSSTGGSRPSAGHSLGEARDHWGMSVGGGVTVSVTMSMFTKPESAFQGEGPLQSRWAVSVSVIHMCG